MIAFLAFAIPLSLYIGLPSCFWNFDGVACAAALELGQPSYFFHANHLIYGFLGFLFWKTIGLPLGIARALPALQFFTSILASLGLIGLYHILLRVIEDRWSALLLSCAMAFTAAFWVWSIEAQVYTLGFLALAWATFTLLEYHGSRQYIYVGLLHGCAVLGHLMHVLWMVPAVYWIARDRRGKGPSVSKALKQYGAALGLVTVIPYVLVVATVIAPGRNPNRIWIWLKGSAALTADRHWAWHSGGWIGPWVWLKSSAYVLWGSFWPYGTERVAPALWSLTALSAAILFMLLIRGWREKSEGLSKFCWIWIGTYGVFLSTWEPQTLCYRITDILPLGILLAIGVRSWKLTAQYVILFAFFITTFTLNLQTTVKPMHHAELNPVYQETLLLAKSTPPDSLYVTGGGPTWIYLLYFTGRTAWNARSLNPSAIVTELHAQRSNRPVFIQSLLLRDPTLAEPLSTLKFKQWSEGTSWLQVQ